MTEFAAPISGATRLAAVIGWPVRHSMSPAIHNAAFGAADLDWRYLALPVPPGEASRAVEGMRSLGIEGLSVTMPHKRAVAAAVDRCTADATALGVVNCVFRDGDHVIGHNTDGRGLVRSLYDDDGVDVSGRRCVVIGAGGAARSVVRALHGAGAADVVVVNRTQAKAADAAALAPGTGRTGSIEAVADAELVVQATSVGMGDDDRSPVPPSLLRADQVVVDLVYHPIETRLLADVAGVGGRPIGGLGMLVHQAAEQFERWTGVEAPVSVMLESARSTLSV